MPKPKTLVLLRGLTREKRHWGRFHHLLQAQLPEAILLTPDLPGNGENFNQTSPTQIQAMTDLLRREIYDELTDHSYLIALSMGGMLAIDWLNRFPGEIRGAVLINTSLKGISPLMQRLRPKALLNLIAALIDTKPASRERRILAMTSASHQDETALIEEWCEYARQHPVQRLNALRQLLAAARFSAPQHPPPHPMLVLSGGCDQLVDPSCSLALAQQWQLPHFQHPDAGHDLPLDAPDWLARQIATWLDREA